MSNKGRGRKSVRERVKGVERERKRQRERERKRQREIREAIKLRTIRLIISH